MLTRIALFALLIALPALAADPPAAREPAGTELYRDASASSSANVTQVLPNAKETSTVLTGVERVAIQADVLVITHGGGAVTLIPKQYVSNITINRRRQ